MSINKRNNNAYGLTQPLINVFNQPIVSPRAPTVRDQAPIGTIWIDQPNDDIYAISKSSAGVNTWINLGGGSGIFSALTVNPGALTVTAGGIHLPAGAITLSALGFGVMQTDATGIVTSTNGTNGQIIIAGTGIAPAWALPTCDDGTITIVPGANSLIIRATGAAVNSYTTTAGGPVVPLAGVLNVLGYDANITTDGATANTVKVRLANNIVSVGTITASTGFSVLAGITDIVSNTNAAGAITLQTNAGVNETMVIESSQGTSAAAISVTAAAGGVNINGGLNSAVAILLNASSVAGGITLEAGTNGITHTITNGAFAVTTGTGAINLGVDAVAHTITIGNATVGTAVGINAGTGNLALTSTGTLTLDSAGALSINSSAAAINIGNNNVSQNINLGTQGVRVITVGNTTGATHVIVNAGTGAIDLTAGGLVRVTPAVDTQAAATVTINANVGYATFTGLTTAAGATQVFTVTCAPCTATSAILCTLSNVGAEDAQMTVMRVTPGAGSFTVTGKNNGAAAVAHNIMLTFWIIKN